MELAAEPGGLLGPGGVAPLSPEQRFSLQHRTDLLEGTSEPVCWGQIRWGLVPLPLPSAEGRQLHECGLQEQGMRVAV